MVSSYNHSVVLCIQSGVEVKKNEEKIKAGLAMFANASTNGPQFGGHKLGAVILEEVKEIRSNAQPCLIKSVILVSLG